LIKYWPEAALKVLVIGGTGFLGSHILTKLLAREDEVTVLTRSHKMAERLAALGIQSVIGDLLHPMDKLTYRIPKQDAVISVPGPQHVPRRILESDLRALQNEVTLHFSSSLEIAEKLDCPLIATLCGSYRTRRGEIADETWPPSRQGAGRIGEMIDPLIAQALDKDFPLVLMLPGQIYGPGGSFEKGLYRDVKDGTFKIIGDGDNCQPWVYVDDLAEAYIRALEVMPIGHRFIIADDEPVTVKDFTETLAHFIGVEVPAVLRPVVARVQLGRLAFETATQNSVVSNARARKYLNWEPAYASYVDGLTVTVSELQERDF
jgi:2-alkyl-3-oxoalkanoate reductase